MALPALALLALFAPLFGPQLSIDAHDFGFALAVEGLLAVVVEGLLAFGVKTDMPSISAGE
jgi:hypothetical protein